MSVELYFKQTFTAETIQQLISWIKEASKIALKHFEDVGFTYKADQSFVTLADLEIEQFLASKIREKFPQHKIVGEELKLDPSRSTDGEVDVYWTIDPIDGTTAFVQGLPGWGIALGALIQGVPRLGFFYMPLLDDLTYIDHQGAVWCKGVRLPSDTLRRDWLNKGYLGITTTAHVSYEIELDHTRALGSNMTNLVYTIRGSAVASFIPKAFIWDIVAGAAILNGVGGEMRYLDGQPINYNDLLDRALIPQPIVGGHPDVLPSLHKKIYRKR